MEQPLSAFMRLHQEIDVECQGKDECDEEGLTRKVTQYVSLLVDSEENARHEDTFDCFCQENGSRLLLRVCESHPLLGLKAASLLLINLKHELHLNYLLCQPFVTYILELPCQQDDQWVEYFISFLKSLSIRLSGDILSLFYNSTYCNFPLFYRAIQYYNHPDCMVRTNVMSIVLAVMKIPATATYCAHYPFTAYLLNLLCTIRDSIILFARPEEHKQEAKTEVSSGNQVYQEETASTFKKQPKEVPRYNEKQLKTYCTDLSDHLYYLNDLLFYASDQLTVFLENGFLNYIILPLLNLLSQPSSRFSRLSAFYTLTTIFKIVKSNTILEVAAYLLTANSAPKIVGVEAYTPLAYTDNSYFRNYESVITDHCRGLFGFSPAEDPLAELHLRFKEEINKISVCLGFNILNYESLQGRRKLSRLVIDHENTADEQVNPFRSILEETVRTEPDEAVVVCAEALLVMMYPYALETKVKTLYDLPGNKALLEGRLEQELDGPPSQLKLANIQQTLKLLNFLTVQYTKQYKYQRIIQRLKQCFRPQNIEIIIYEFEDSYQKIDCSFEVDHTIFKEKNEENGEQGAVLHWIRVYVLLEKYVAVKNQEKQCFTTLYRQKFNRTSRWKVNEFYHIQHRKMLECGVRKEGRVQKGMIIEDEFSLVVVELSNQRTEVRIAFNQKWKKAEIVMSKQEGSVIMLGRGKMDLVFDNQIKSNVAYSYLQDLKRRCFEVEQAFILQYLRSRETL